MVRKSATALTVVAVGFTVAILVLVLSLARGFELSFSETGRTDNAVFLRKGATSEGESVIDFEQARLIMARPEIASGPDSLPMAVAEMYAGVSLEKSVGGSTNVSIRGTSESVLALRDGVRIGEGRMFRPGTREVVVGKALVGRVSGCRLGGAIEFADDVLPVVGILDSEGGAFDSEIWGDARQVMDLFDRGAYSVVVARLRDAATLSSLREIIATDPQLSAKVFSEKEYFRQQSTFLGAFLKGMAYFLAAIMAVGAVFGSTNTLLASLAGRSREIGTLLALGYRPWHVLVGFMLEALVIGLMGGVVGVLIALPINGVATGTTNWNTFTEQAFAFAITGDVIIEAILFAGIVGVIGGVLPAIRAASLPPTEALRA
jgi:ABC-type antimicrobial peptide transport system permease subunit